MTIARCEKCKIFEVPWDPIGAALMQEHLKRCEGPEGIPAEKLGIPTSSGPSCTCGYESANSDDFQQHVVATMMDDDDHFEKR